ncbi:uncharacterized protein LOC126371076 isoform X2 [Pectinophora gossypiella]|nr:uncharacterized protein LOC126371076 isoform X2 [Pectinophora gossypiella]XP_049872222.1 uncharacterized protein LOC126371076 isoform X2 [Pectinophora gossypiella]XP_049872223.1 uncharacterized protein LOC126371076 isoform X2 [Pectinophora gossypiella]
MNMSSDIPNETDSTTETKHNTTPEPALERPETENSSHQLVQRNTPSNQPIVPSQASQPYQAAPIMSYAGASRSTGAVPKQLPKPRPPPTNALVWTEQLRQIITYYNQGSRILILMRGIPGSGKTYLARQIIEITIGATYADFKTHILSTDDFFMVRGKYLYDKSRISEAHEWNQRRSRAAMRQGLSPIIIDNTNVEIWEMEPYVKEGVRNGYYIEVVEPNTPWAKKANQLLKRNTHNVPPATICRMLDNYQDGITGEFLKKYYGLSYPAKMVPPVMRNMPVFEPPQSRNQPDPKISTSETIPPAMVSEPIQHGERDVKPQTPDCNQPQREVTEYLPNFRSITTEVESEEEEEIERQQRYIEIQKQIEKMEKVEQEWENNEGWDSEPQETNRSANENSTSMDPRPQRRTHSEGSSSTPRDNLLESVQTCDDWRKISMFMPPWTDDTSTTTSQSIEIPVRETKSSETCMEIGDTDLQNPKKVFKIITATPRDINLFYINLQKEKIPDKRRLDKSTTTNELLITETYRCKNEEQHFIAFRKLFKNVPKASLRDIFDKCCGDVNWAVDIVLGGMADNQLETTEGDEASDTEVEMEEQCNCLAAYHIIPDAETRSTANPATTADEQNIPIEPTCIPKKTKTIPSDSTIQLLRSLEKNVVLSNEHYSEHMLKMKKFREGGSSYENSEQIPFNINLSSQNHEIEIQPSTSRNVTSQCNHLIAVNESQSDDEESVASSVDEAEKMVNINLGAEFVSQLDDLFGRQGMTYPATVVPRINIPVSLLNEINAFWIESLMCQLDELDKQTAKMLKEDEEFARQLTSKEAELAQQGKEPEFPDFKEIMDMDFALSLYQKDVAEWRTKEPKDMAARLSRDKLYNLFPEMTHDILSELLMAHDNNFQATVEVLLMSTGKADILQEKNGLSKFVMAKEMELQEKLLEEEKQALSDLEWPLLPKGEKVEMAVVDRYRQKADEHLATRNLNYQKAQDYIRRGMTQVANYYSDIAQFHKKKYEQANSLAAASLIQVHASNNPDNATIDLHYLRVGEAKESLDIFLDTHIQKLKESTRKGVRFQTLFFITGRGLHSNGRPKVKPAVKKRLRERGLAFSERNPGLLTATVCADDKLSYQVKVP